MRDIRELKNKHRGERCFVIGNGIDLKRMDLSKMKNDITISCNLIGRLMTPTYFCIGDSHVYATNKTEIDANKCKNKIFCYGPEPAILFKDIPSDSYVVELSNLPITRLDKDFNLHKGVKNSGTVIPSLCLPLAYYMGIKEVYLVGCECTQGHFYTKWNIKNSSIHLVALFRTILSFELEYLKKFLKTKHYATDPRTWDWINRDYEAVHMHYYERVKEIFENDNRKICNATLAGILDVFERVDYNQLF